MGSSLTSLCTFFNSLSLPFYSLIWDLDWIVSKKSEEEKNLSIPLYGIYFVERLVRLEENITLSIPLYGIHILFTVFSQNTSSFFLFPYMGSYRELVEFIDEKGMVLSIPLYGIVE